MTRVALLGRQVQHKGNGDETLDRIGSAIVRLVSQQKDELAPEYVV